MREQSGVEYAMHGFVIVSCFFSKLPDLVLFANFVFGGHKRLLQRNFGARYNATRDTRKMPTMLSIIPARTIFGIVSIPEPKTIAFGGVATGSMKAQLAAKVTGTASTIGSKPDSMAMAPTTGRNVAVVAMLLVSSVRKMIIVAATMTMAARGRVPMACKLLPNHSARPVRETALARVRPPPNRSYIAVYPLLWKFLKVIHRLYLKYHTENIVIALPCYGIC